MLRDVKKQKDIVHKHQLGVHKQLKVPDRHFLLVSFCQLIVIKLINQSTCKFCFIEKEKKIETDVREKVR